MHSGRLFYKCRFCGVTYPIQYVAPDVATVMSFIMCNKPLPEEWGSLPPRMLEFHRCETGVYGVADLIGGREGV